MRHEATTVSNSLASSDAPSTPAPADEAVRGIDRAGPVLLGILVAATCLTVAVLASAWLVVPYLAVLAVILRSPRGPRPRVSGRTTRIDAPTVPDPRIDGPDETAAAAGPAAVALPSAPIEAARPRSRRGRGRKARPVPEAGPIGEGPQWVRVGPGKFVRADSPPNEAEAETEVKAEVEVEVEVGVDVPAQIVVEDTDSTEAQELEASAAPVETGETATEDQGIAPNVPAALVDDDPVADGPSDSGSEVVSVSVSASVADDLRVRRRQALAVRLVGTLARTCRRGPTRTVAAVGPRWNARAGRTGRALPGFVRPAPARRNLRHSGRFHRANRLHPPRSPPARAK